MSIHVSETNRPSYSQFRSDYAAEIEVLAEVLAEEEGTRLWLLTPDERAHVMALATRAVKHARSHYDTVETDVDEKLADAEDRLATAARELVALVDSLPQPADKLAKDLEAIYGTLTADNS